MDIDLADNFKRNFRELGRLRQNGEHSNFLNLLKDTVILGVKYRNELSIDMRTHFLHSALDLFNIAKTRENATLLSRLLENNVQQVLYLQKDENNISIHLTNPLGVKRIALVLNEIKGKFVNTIMSEVFENDVVFVVFENNKVFVFTDYATAKNNGEQVLNMVVEK